MLKKSNFLAVSKFGFLIIFIFLFLSFLGRLVFPFGDEPDFSVRAPNLIFGEPAWWNPYFFLKDILHELQYISNCKIESSPLSLIQKIDSTTCFEEVNQSLHRLLITFFT